MEPKWKMRVELLKLAVASAAIFGAALVLSTRFVAFLNPHTAARTDFAQVYVMARAIRAGQNPYVPVPQLVRQYLDETTTSRNPHPSPYPPPLPLLLANVPSVRLPIVSVAWLILSAVSAFASIALLNKETRLSLSSWLVAGSLLIISAAGASELTHQQFGFMSLLAIAGCWVMLKDGREILAGVFLAIPIAVKGFGVPILLFFFLRRRYRALIASFFALMSVFLCSLAAGGADLWIKFLRAAPTSTTYWANSFQNQALQTLPLRLISGPLVQRTADGAVAHVGSGVPNGWLLNVGVVLTLSVAVLIALASRRVSEKTAYALFVILTPFFGPVSWLHYTVIFAVPLMLLARETRSSKKVLIAWIFIAFVIFVDPTSYIAGFVLPFEAGTIVRMDAIWTLLATTPLLLSIAAATLLLCDQTGTSSGGI